MTNDVLKEPSGQRVVDRKTLQNHLVFSFIIGLNFEAEMEAPILLLCQNIATYNLSPRHITTFMKQWPMWTRFMSSSHFSRCIITRKMNLVIQFAHFF